mmetsp:Transcript_9327/g.34918  ORF Transcript_9327/g.34918 Transcript_9327/m.34918 type:complete len:267 (+) Transcript_9327:870-1670(+)
MQRTPTEATHRSEAPSRAASQQASSLKAPRTTTRTRRRRKSRTMSTIRMRTRRSTMTKLQLRRPNVNSWEVISTTPTTRSTTCRRIARGRWKICCASIMRCRRRRLKSGQKGRPACSPAATRAMQDPRNTQRLKRRATTRRRSRRRRRRWQRILSRMNSLPSKGKERCRSKISSRCIGWQRRRTTAPPVALLPMCFMSKVGMPSSRTAVPRLARTSMQTTMRKRTTTPLTAKSSTTRQRSHRPRLGPRRETTKQKCKICKWTLTCR